MTDLCGTPHYRYPETLCTEPAGHYVPDRDPHAGFLILDGRQAGAAAWDEPKEQHMSDRHTVDSITSDALDQLYDQLADHEKRIHRLTTELRRYTDRESAEATADSYTHRAHHAETAIERVRHIANLIDAGAPWTASHHDTANRIREALDGEQDIEPALTATDTATTTRVFAALHRSTEEDVTRVIALHERWVKAGPPPLGTIVARWWDARLVELHDAIRPPASQTQEQP